jgi:hypothetical protein
MWRYMVGGAAALVLALAGMFLFRGSAASEAKAPSAPAAQAAAQEAPLPDEAPSADERTREQKRFDRIDKDRDQSVTRDEFFALRKKLFAKMDVDHNGTLSFDEWAVRGIKRFGDADKDRSGALNRTEFATTAVKRRPAKPGCVCAKPQAKAAPQQESAGDGEEE